jgi:hypothetical protein
MRYGLSGIIMAKMSCGFRARGESHQDKVRREFIKITCMIKKYKIRE